MEADAIEEWLAATLGGDEDLRRAVDRRVYGHVAPVKSAYPYLVYLPDSRGGEDLNTLGSVRGVVERFYEVKVVGQGGGFSPLREVKERIDALLHGAERQDVDPRFFCERVEDIRDADVDGRSNIYYESGGVYRFLVTPEA